MPIRPPILKTDLLRASGATPVVRAWRSLNSQERPSAWYALVTLAPGRYGVFAAHDVDQELQGRLRAEPDLPLSAVVAAAPTADSEEDDLAALQALASRPPYVVVLRDGEPIGIVMLKRPRGVLSGEDLPIAGGPTLPAASKRADRYVNTSFADQAAPLVPLDRSARMQAGGRYYFRLSVGRLEAGAIDVAPSELPPEIQDRDVELDVVVFSDDFTVEQAQGRIRVPTSGPAQVTDPASLPEGIAAASDAGRERLFFLVTAPQEERVASLRCNLYFRGLLIQSRLVAAAIGAAPALDEAGALRQTTLDFNLSSSLLASALDGVAEHRLSLMVNSDAEGTHGFRVAAQDGGELFSSSATLAAGELQNEIDMVRKRLRQVAWGKEGEWDAAKDSYRYDPGLAPEELLSRLREDLRRLALRGSMIYNSAIKDIAGGRQGQRELRTLMRAPAMVQLASKHTASDIAPIALFYDRKIDDQADLTVCPAFEQSLASGRPLIDEPCFQGSCPHDGDLTVVCPSGFWGFRHDIGMPYPVRARGPELATSISYTATPRLEIGYFADFKYVNQHLEQLGGLGYQVERAAGRADLFKLFQSSEPQLIYFYCHGIENDTIPYLWIGKQAGKDYISTSNFANYEIEWPEARPLVFINGCHTTALAPQKALSFVKAFVEDTAAAGVIGTEITIFEPMAQRFAETFLRLFLAGERLGRAVRAARLELLAQRNPLGLVYMPHAYAGLRLEKSS